MRSARLLAVALTVLLVVGCGSRPPLPSPTVVTGTPEIGVPYRVVVACAVDFQLGNTYWRFVDSEPWPPALPTGPTGAVIAPYPVPATVTLTSPDAATFRADVDGSALALTRTDTPQEAGCV